MSRVNIGKMNSIDVARAVSSHDGPRTGMVEIGRVDPANRGLRAASHIARPHVADEGYNVYEIAPGIEIRTRSGVQVALANIGTEEVPVFVLTPGAMIEETTGFTVSGARSAREGKRISYVGGVGFLPLLIGPLAKLVGREVQRVNARNRGEEDAADSVDAEGKATTSGMVNVIGALMIDSDGHRTDTDD